MNVLAPVAAAGAVLVVGARFGVLLWPPRTPGDDASAPVATSRSRLIELVRRAIRRGRQGGTPGLGDVEVAGWCDEAARSLRAGSTLTVAAEEAAAAIPAMREVIDPVLSAVRRGRSLAEALGERHVGPDGSASSAAGLALTVVRASAELGGPAAAPLERVAATLRTRAAVAEEQLAHSAQARLSAQVLTVVPVALLALLAATAADIREALFTVPGALLVAVGAGLNLAGWRWMQRIVRGGVR